MAANPVCSDSGSSGKQYDDPSPEMIEQSMMVEEGSNVLQPGTSSRLSPTVRLPRHRLLMFLYSNLSLISRFSNSHEVFACAVYCVWYPLTIVHTVMMFFADTPDAKLAEVYSRIPLMVTVPTLHVQNAVASCCAFTSVRDPVLPYPPLTSQRFRLIYLFYTLGYSAAPGIVVMIIFIPMNILSSMAVRRWQMQQMKLKDERTKMVVKLYAWEVPMEEHIEGIRRKELSLIRKAASVRNILDSFNTASPFLVGCVRARGITEYIEAATN